MSFGSNVAPKRKLDERYPQPWYCPHCDAGNPAYARICLTPGCREVRPNPNGESKP